MGLINVLYVCVYSMQGMHAWKILWSIVMILLSCLCVIIKYNDYLYHILLIWYKSGISIRFHELS